jgi:hypothetical protein
MDVQIKFTAQPAKTRGWIEAQRIINLAFDTDGETSLKGPKEFCYEIGRRSPDGCWEETISNIEPNRFFIIYWTPVERQFMFNFRKFLLLFEAVDGGVEVECALPRLNVKVTNARYIDIKKASDIIAGYLNRPDLFLEQSIFRRIAFIIRFLQGMSETPPAEIVEHKIERRIIKLKPKKSKS